MIQNDYDMYTAGWGGGPDVDWLYDLFIQHHLPRKTLNFSGTAQPMQL